MKSLLAPWLALALVASAEPASHSAAIPARPGHASDTVQVVPNDGRAPAGALAAGTLDLKLVARPARWRPEGPNGPEVSVYAFAEEGQAPRIPGPMVRVPVGTVVGVTVRNALPEPLQLFGIQDRPSQKRDTVELQPGETRRLTMRAGAPGTYLYHARTTRDTFPFPLYHDSQLYGAIVVDSSSRADDRVLLIGLWKARETPPGTPIEEREEILVLNGLAWPHTERLSHTVGDSIRWRVINATRRGHPMHLHGFYFRVDARGTLLRDTVYAPPQQRLGVTELLAPGTSMSITWSPHTPGNWLFHCHLVQHIAGHVRLSDHKTTHDPKANHALEAMSGLVMGINVRPRPGATLAGDPAARRQLRLFVTETPRRFGPASAYSFVLQDGSREPARDSLRVPGSPILLTRGEPTSIAVLNRATVPVSIHWHGIELESYYDGVGGWSGIDRRIAPSIAPGDSFVVRMTPDRAGTFIYHTHFNETRQLGAGLYGPLLVLEPGAQRDTVTDRILLLGSGAPTPGAPPNLNGSVNPPPMELRAGTTYRLRFISISPDDVKTVRLLADTVIQRWRRIGKDGAALPPHQAVMARAQLTMGAGETWDVEITPAVAGEQTLEIITTGQGIPPRRMRVPVRVR